MNDVTLENFNALAAEIERQWNLFNAQWPQFLADFAEAVSSDG